MNDTIRTAILSNKPALLALLSEAPAIRQSPPVPELAPTGALAQPTGRPFYADPARLADERIRCTTCQNLTPEDGRCQAAARGELVMTARTFRPPLDRLFRCLGYLPTADDPDRRPGTARWRIPEDQEVPR